MATSLSVQPFQTEIPSFAGKFSPAFNYTSAFGDSANLFPGMFARKPGETEATAQATPESSAGAEKGEWQAFLEYFKSQNTPEALREKAAVQREFQLQMMKDAAPYKLAFELPGTIMNAVTKPALIQLAGSSRIADIIGEGSRRMQFAGISPVSTPQIKSGYFG